MKNSKLVLIRFFALLGMVCACVHTLAQDVSKPLSFGVVPQQSATKLAQDWGPLLAEVSRRSGVALVFRTAPSIPQFEERLSQGAYDLAYMNPYHYVVFHGSAGYLAFAKEKDRKLKGILVVRKDSTYQNPGDLAGKVVVFPAPAAFAASILPQAELGRLQVPFTAKFVTSHDSVYRAVAAGMQEAGGGIRRTFEALPIDIRSNLRVLAETTPYTPHAFAAHPRVSSAVLARVRGAMLSLETDEVGQRLLAPLAFKGVAAAQDSDWNDIRALDIDLLSRYSKE